MFSFGTALFRLLSKFPESGIVMRNYFKKYNYFNITKSQHEWGKRPQWAKQVEPPKITEKKFEEQNFVSTTKEVGSHPDYLDMDVLSAYWDPMSINSIFSTLPSPACTDLSHIVHRLCTNGLGWKTGMAQNTAEQSNSAWEQNQKNIA